MEKAIIITVFIMLVSGAVMMPCGGDEIISDPDLRTFDGKVVGVNVGKSTLTVSGVAEIIFPISLDTELRRDIYDIKLSDIKIGDYANVEYYRQGSESRVPTKVLRVTVQ